MKQYQSIKKVSARPMDYHTAGKERIRGYNEHNENCEGYEVVYEDGYISWSPKNVFEDGYKELSQE